MTSRISECREYMAEEKARVAQGETLGASLRMAEIALSDFSLYLREQKKPTFHELLFDLIDRSGGKDSEIYKKAQVDRRLFSKIRSSKKYLPCKKTVIALCLALALSREEADALLRSAGYSLSASEDFDLAIAFCIAKGIYDFDEINGLLDSLGLDLL